MQHHQSIFVAGGHTLLGSALVRELERLGFRNVLGKDAETDLTSAAAVDAFFAEVKPEYVIVAAGISGGIQANIKCPADLMLDNLLLATHVIPAAFHYKVRKLLYLASSCSYPRDCSQPMQVEYLLTGPLEPTNEAYAVAKIAGIKLCQAYRQQYRANFITGIPSDAFGPGDDFSVENSHVVAALIRRMHEAKLARANSVVVWGSGTPKREFSFVDDVASACIFAMQHYDAAEMINLGGGTPTSIKELAETIREVVGFQGNLNFDTRKPDGMPVKLLDSSKVLSLGWRPRISLCAGLAATYAWYVNHGISEGW
jgi:GDP-L-fucose synthase